MKHIFKKSSYLFTIIALIVTLSGNMSYAESLYVFYPTTARSKVLQEKMGADCPDIALTIFGRFRDFQTKITESPPDAILTKKPVINEIKGYTIKLQGTRKNSTDESFILLSVDEAIDPAKLADLTVGVLDILGRKGMGKHVAQYFDPVPKLKRVTKIEDLLPLLSFNMAKAILISDNRVSYFKKLSKLNFIATPVPNMQIGIVALAVKDGANADAVINSIKGVGDDTTSLLEVDNWK